MKTILITILITISIFASGQQDARKIPSHVVDVIGYSLIDSKDAFFILGIKKYGMMQKSWAFSNKEDAQAYAEKHGGCIVDYATYIKMDDKKVDEYVKKHGIVIAVDKNTTKSVDKNSTIKKNNSNSDVYSIKNRAKYKF